MVRGLAVAFVVIAAGLTGCAEGEGSKEEAEEADACRAVAAVDSHLRRFPGPDLDPYGGDDAIAVRNWKKQAIGVDRLWEYAYGIRGDEELGDSEFRDVVRQYYDRILPMITAGYSVDVVPSPFPALLADTCAGVDAS